MPKRSMHTSSSSSELTGWRTSTPDSWTLTHQIVCPCQSVPSSTEEPGNTTIACTRCVCHLTIAGAAQYTTVWYKDRVLGFGTIKNRQYKHNQAKYFLGITSTLQKVLYVILHIYIKGMFALEITFFFLIVFLKVLVFFVK